MNKQLAEFRRLVAMKLDKIGGSLQHRFYLYMAVILTIVAIVDFFSTHMIVGMRNQSFDTMVQSRFRVTPPASDIVIVDIDEKSLAAMASEFGRWPWPRQVFGEFVEKLNAQKPDAIVFDIMFSDPDIYNTESDIYFDEVIGKTTNTWFPMIRLPLSADTASRLNAGQIPGARAVGPVDSTSTIGIILPFFRSVQESKRVGFNNIVPDPDGVSREYPIRYRESGFEIASLPLAVTRGLDSTIEVPDKVLLNWRGKPFTYSHVSFCDVYGDMRIEKPTRPSNEFEGKIIIIGSTAPSLFDIKVTALDKQFPGVEILATAIDNLRAGDWLRVPNIPFVYLLITIVILWLTALGFYRQGTGGHLDQFYGISQFILIVIAYTAINLFCVYINLTGPVMFGFIYYSIARTYSVVTSRILDKSVVRIQNTKDGAQGFILLLRFNMPTREDVLITQLAKVLTARCTQKPSTELLIGHQKGMWRFLENTLMLCWRADAHEKELILAIRNEAEKIRNLIPEALKSKPLAGALPLDHLTINYAESTIGTGEPQEWLVLLAKAITCNKGENA